LPTNEKIEAVAELKERLANNEVAVMAKYVGINVAKMTELRNRLRQNDVEFKVYKNTLAHRALREMNLEAAAEFMDGPTAWAFSKDPLLPAKLLKQFAVESKFVSMSGGILANKVVTKQQLEALATLPSKDVLVAQVVGTIAAPLRNLVGVLSAGPRNLVNALEEIRKQKEAGAAAA
jgi:large subunit ribosomal protein L10